MAPGTIAAMVDSKNDAFTFLTTNREVVPKSTLFIFQITIFLKQTILKGETL